MRLLLLSIISLAIAGCATRVEPVPDAPLATQPSARLMVADNAITLDLDPQSCVCHLGQVDVALLSLPGVWRLDWEAEIFRVSILFRDADTPRPSDAQIAEAMSATDVKLKAIHRP